LSEENLINDTIIVIKHIAEKFPEQAIILVGHSMGGSIAVKAAHHIQTHNSGEEWSKHIVGVYIIDVVEGSAMEALPFMENIVMKRPKKFKNIQAVV
jgi:protein phosphatase methylesterase 1